MIKNYILIVLRNMSRRGLFPVLNIAGLATGMACSLIILMWVDHELSFDRFHTDHKNIYRLGFRAEIAGNSMDVPVAMAPLADVLTGTFSEVDQVVRINVPEDVNVMVDQQNFMESRILMADSSFFNLFGFELVSGDPSEVLKDPFTIVLTRRLAEKYFGDEYPVGRTVRINNSYDYTVTGIAADPPSNTHVPFDAVTSFVSLYDIYPPGGMDQWLSLSYFFYIKVNNSFDRLHFFANLEGLFEERFGQEAADFGIKLDPFLQPVSSIHLDSNMLVELSAPGSKSSVYIFLAISVFILMLACINFMNLTTARASLRSKEVGLRKVSGATRGNLIAQFIGESVMFSLIAVLFAVPAIELALPLFNNLTGLGLSFLSSENSRVLLLLPVFIFVVGLIAGSYPAFILSAYSPVRTLKGEKLVSSGRSGLRSGLIIFQMVISITLVICTAFVWKQLRYINSADIGFDRSDKLIVHLNTPELRARYQVISAELTTVPGVRDVSASNSYPGMEFSGTIYVPEGYENEIVGTYLNVDFNYLGLMDIDVIQGRGFNPAFPADSFAVLVNETAVRTFGWTDPLERTINRGRDHNIVTYRVIGVVRDFNFRSMHRQVEPLMIHLLPGAPRYITVDAGPLDLHLTAAALKQRWDEINPDEPFEFRLLSDEYDMQYRTENQLSSLFSWFSLLAFFIAALGMYGLSSFMVENKTREIGIRKVFGAPVRSIVFDFFRQFAFWLIIANMVSWAAAWYLMDRWLDSFAYKISLADPVVFIVAALVSVFVVMLAAGYQSYRAAGLDPARSLRYE